MVTTRRASMSARKSTRKSAKKSSRKRKENEQGQTQIESDLIEEKPQVGQQIESKATDENMPKPDQHQEENEKSEGVDAEKAVNQDAPSAMEISQEENVVEDKNETTMVDEKPEPKNPPPPEEKTSMEEPAAKKTKEDPLECTEEDVDPADMEELKLEERNLKQKDTRRKDYLVKKLSELDSMRMIDLNDSKEDIAMKKYMKRQIEAITDSVHNIDKLSSELKALQTTDTADLLQETKEAADQHAAAQQNVINFLTSKVESLEDAEKNNINEVEKLRVENQKLAAELSKLKTQRSDSENEENMKATGNTKEIAEARVLISQAESICKCYERLTGMSLKLEKGVMKCTVKNPMKRKAVKFQVSSTGNKHIEFTPVANVSLLPPELREVGVFKAPEAPILLSRVVENLNL